MVTITFDDINGSQARYLIKLADMMRISHNRVQKPDGLDWKNPETKKDVEKIQEIIDKNSMY